MTVEGIFRRRRLPHWDVADATFFVTACLAHSIPARGLGELREYRRELEMRPRPPSMSESQWEIHKHKLVFARFEAWIDLQPAARHLHRPELAAVVRDGLYRFAGERYWLLAYVIMPSHYHWVFKPIPQWCDALVPGKRVRTPRERIMHSIQSFTSNQCNALAGRRGSFWQAETYDHCIRGQDELLRVIEYVERNPVKAKLVDRAELWEHSSAFDRARNWVEWGQPLEAAIGLPRKV